MKANPQKSEPIVFSPNLTARDVVANYWMRQATLRLRREIAWIWNHRGSGGSHQPGELPPFIDRASESLDLTRHWPEKQEFFDADIAARYLTGELAIKRPVEHGNDRGSFSWLVAELGLDDVATFTLALCLNSALDSSTGAIIASCLNDSSRIHPNLMLVQRLWDQPEDVLKLSDPAHPLFSTGLLRRPASAHKPYAETLWEQPLSVPSLVARTLLGYEVSTGSLKPIDPAGEAGGEISETVRLIGHRLRAEECGKLRVVPLLGNRRAAFRQTAIDVARVAGLSLWEYAGDPALLADADYFGMLSTLAWLKGRALFIRQELFPDSEHRRERNDGLPFVALPATLLIGVADRKQVAHIEPELLLPFVPIPALDYEMRLETWREAFGRKAKKYEPILREAARRFRYEKETIRDICAELLSLPEDPTEDDMIAACRAELTHDVGDLASYVEPRFIGESLFLPNKQAIQFEEQLAAMRALTKVHYDWGTARAWNEGGITVMFAGPPGTGKTMAAEIMAQRLRLPMYKVDLSQVVNKYIGETEKNLKRIFDAADISDMVLFFDEADAIFRKRTEVSDSRDSYANLTVSYLLERMERFKGLAILATNRKDDLDKAFVRRIRHIIEFPAPDEAQRAAIWRQVIPASVAANSKIDIAFLARQFPLSGGHIRSIVFNACLQSAATQTGEQELFMRDVLIAVKREYDKMNRSLSLEQLGPYAAQLAGLE